MTEQNMERRCKDTKRLIKIAVEHGLTNSDIAELAGLSRKSIAQVSRWRNGTALATERQMGHFIKEYGDILKRKIEHLLFQEEDNKFEFFKINGEVLFKHCIKTHQVINRRPIKIALMRILVLKQHNHFYLVYQSRSGIDKTNGLNGLKIQHLSHSDNEDANWNTYKVLKNLSPDSLVIEVDKYAFQFLDHNNPLKVSFPESVKDLGFIVRQALLKQGFQSNDIIDLCSK
jgi:transcriptional regulator with XRE-family HTH domain